MKMNITLGVNFIYKSWTGYINKHWAGHKFNVSIMNIYTFENVEFTVKPHWYVNEDWDRALKMAKEYIDINLS